VKTRTKSIAEVGIVVPLVGDPALDGTYLLAAGERVHDRDPRRGVYHGPVCRAAVERDRADRVHADREDDRNPLKPTELAAGCMRMVPLGCSVRRLAAKVGRSAKHVSSHMALLELPERAQREVDEGTCRLPLRPCY
jgi:ParB-like chromosome segregation protein Spo0J